MRSILFLVLLCCGGLSYGQGNGFTFNYSGPTQIIVGPECLAVLDWGHPNTPTVQSNIPGGMIVSFTIYSISDGYEINDLVPGGTNITVFYQAVDNFGNTVLFGFTIAFIDVLPPTFDPASLPQNLTVNCIGNFPIADVEIHDNCEDQDIVLTLEFSETNNAAQCTGGLITRTWIADDDLGNTAVFVQTITVLPDNTPPVIANNLQNGSAPCATAMAQYTSWLQTQRAAFNATDNGCGLMSLTDNAPSPSQITSFCGVITVTFTAKDVCNNMSTVQRTFTVTNNVSPVITIPASGSSGNCSQSNINQLFNTWIGSHGGADATDDCSSILWTTFPAAPSIHDTCDAAIAVMFIAGDGCGNFDTTSASFILTDDTGPAITAQPMTLFLNCSSPTVDSLLLDWLTDAGHSAAHDLCTADDELALIYRLAGNDQTLEEVLNAWQDSLQSECHENVVVNGVGIHNVKAYLEVRFVYVDNCENETGVTGFFGVTDNGRPVYLTEPVDTSFACSEGQGWQDVFLDWYNTAGGATYTDMCSAVTVQASITADSAITYLSSSLDTACLQGVQVSILFGLVDGCGNTSLTMPQASFSLQDTIPPVLITQASDFIASCSSNGEEQLQDWIDTLGGASATDGCGSIMWIFSWVDTTGMTINGIPGEGPYPPVSSFDCTSGVEVVFTAADICQNSVSDTAVFSFIDTIPPVIILEADTVYLGCQDSIPINLPDVTDACTDSLIISFQDSVGIDSCFGLPNIVIRTWTAVDACGNSSAADQFFIRLDTIPPTFELPDDTVQFCTLDTLFLTNVNDNCDPSPVVTWEDILTDQLCQQMLTRTWIVTDACGNSSTAIQQFDLSDNSPPEIIYSPGNFVFSCTESPGDLQAIYEQWMDSVTIADGCSATDYFIAMRGTYVLEDTATWPGKAIADSVMLMCDTEISVQADLVAYDICGNVIVEEISFTVIDTTGPVFISCQPVIPVIPDTTTCNAIVQLVRPAFEDACFPDHTHIHLQIDGGDPIDMDTIASIDTLLDVGIHTALWTASDCKGNTSTCLSSIEIIDENAVSLTCPADTLLFTGENDCSVNLWVYPPVTSSGKCAKGVIELRFEILGHANPDSVVFNSPTDSVFVEFMVGIHQVLLIARDGSGDIDTCIYRVELRDTIDPAIVCQTDTLLIPPSGLENIDLSSTSLVVSSSDNCTVENIIYDPPFVNCDNNGQSVPVTITVFDQSGNESSCVTSLFVTTQPLQPLWERGLCDDTLRLFANLPGAEVNYLFTWSGPNSFSSNEENPLIPDADTSYSGTYFLTVQSDSGCVSTGSVEVLIQTLVSPSITTPDDSICAGDDITLTTQTYSGIVIYQWHQILPAGDTLITSTSEPVLTLSLDSPGTNLFYAIVMQDTCSSVPGPVLAVYVSPVPDVSVLDPMMPLCIYDSLFLSPQIIIDSLQYHWTGPNAYEVFIPDPPGIPVTGIDSGSVFILTASTQSCTSAPDTLNVILQPPTAIPVITGDTSTCEGGTIQLIGNSTADGFEWISPSNLSILTTGDSLLIGSADQTHSGGWHVIAEDNGCFSDTSEAFFVQIDTVIEISILVPDQICEGDSILLIVAPPNDATFSWTGPNGFTSNEVSPSVLAENGIYSVSVLTTTGCEAEDSILVTVDKIPAITSLVVEGDSCANGSGIIQISAIIDPGNTGAYEYQWTGPSNFSSQDSALVFQNATASLNGLYNLYVVNGSCVSDTATIELSLKDIPAAPLITGDQVYCNGDSIVLNIQSPVEGGIYTWSSTDTTIVASNPGTLIIPDADQSFTGVYTVYVTLEGCVSLPTIFAVQVRPPLVAPVITAPALVCEGDSLALTSNAPGAIVQWSGPNGFLSNDIRPVIFPATTANAGLYSVYYTLNGCQSPVSAPVEVKIQSTISAPGLDTFITRICLDNPVPVNICQEIESGTGGATYTWILNGSVINETLNPITCIVIESSAFQGGINTISVLASLQGCQSDTSNILIITADEFPDVEAYAGPDMQFCPDESIILEAADPSPAAGIWTSSSGVVVFVDTTNPNSPVNALLPGEYTMTWTLSFESCIDYSSDEVVIVVLFSPEVIADTIDVPFGQNVEFSVTANDTLPASPFILEIVSGTQKGNALHAGNGNFRYTPNIGFVGTDFFTYRICSTDCPEECSEAIVVLKVGNEDDCFVPTLFTPNDDGVNDVLIIPCLETERFPQNKIMVFNEWGAVVYTSSPYQNDWDGSVSGDPLPSGTYFYIMDFGDGSAPKKTFLVLER